MAKKNTFCADTSEMTDIEKKLMANAMKAGQDQINILREGQAKNQKENSVDPQKTESSDQEEPEA